VPNAALRIRPTPEMQAELGIDTTTPAGAPGQAGARAAGAQGGQAARAGGGPGAGGQRPGGARPAAGAAGRPSVSTLYFVKDGKLATARVTAGITDGTVTEISGPEVTEGMQVIVGLNQPQNAGAGTTNPFQQQGPGGGGPGGGGPGGGFGGPR
jgi:HlyD family secretion protein